MRKRLWLAAAAIATALVCGELLLRVVGFSAPVWRQPDTDLGWTLRPELREVNLHGARDRERILAKPADVYRIAVLGDEYSEALGLPIEHTWWRVLERMLDGCDFRQGKRVEVLNFGIGGFGTAQQYIQLQTDAIRYRPDLVLLQFNNADDVRNNSFILEPQKERPFFMLDAKGDLAIDDSFATAPGFRTRASLRHQLLRKVSDKARVAQLLRALRDVPFISQAQALEQPGNDATWEEAWRITEALIAQTQDFATRNGSQLALVIVPDRRELLAPDASSAQRRLQALSARHGIAAIALEPEMQRRGNLAPLFEEKEGHQATAEIVAGRLCKAG